MMGEIDDRRGRDDDGGHGGGGRGHGDRDRGGGSHGEGGHGGGGEMWSVSGIVLNADGSPLAGAMLVLVRKRLRREVPLVEGYAERDGKYRLVYRRPEDRGSVDLVLRVVAGALAESPILYNAGPIETINLSLAGAYRGPSELTALLAEISPEQDGVAIGALEQDAAHKDLTFLANVLAADGKKIAILAIAYKVAAKAGGVPAEAFYALFRGGIPSQLAGTLQSLDSLVVDDTFVANTLDAVLSQSLEVLKAAIQGAIAKNIIPTTVAANLDAIMARLGELRLAHVSSKPYVRGKTAVSQLLAVGGLAPTLQKKFLAAFATDPQDAEAAIAVLRKDPSVTKTDISTLRFTLGTGELLGGNMLLLQHAVEQRTSGAIKGASDLAKRDIKAWTALITELDPEAKSIQQVLPAETAPQRIERLATTLAYRFEKRFPTPALLGRLANDPASPIASAKDLTTFLSNNADFELRDMHLDRYLSDNPKALGGVANAPQVVEDLKRVQRVFKLFPSYDAVKPLVADGLHSAQAIYVQGETRFVEKYAVAMGKTVATDVYRRSERTYARALALHAKYNGAFNMHQPAALGAPPTQPTTSTAGGQQPQSAFADLQALFGSLDYCQCSDCRSIVSPAAYFVDILQFLGKRAAVAGSARDVLQKRRPDLWDVMLSCDNTNIPLPFIDLVCEVLEDAITPSTTSKPIDRQSSGSPDDLRATPAFVNADAYEVLRGAKGPVVFPLSMPFDLWIEQSRAYLRALGWARSDLMKLLRDATPSPSDDLIGAEALGFSPGEHDLLVGATLGVNPWDLWGLGQNGNTVPDPKNPKATKSGSWTDLLSYVPIFQQRAQLSYNELLQLLDVRFVNPVSQGGSVVQLVDSPDQLGFVSCDTGHMSLQGLASAQDWTTRANAFLRLWRKTGMAMWDLDRILRCAGIGAGTISTALFAPFAQAASLKKRLGLPWDELLSFWGPLDMDDAVNHIDGSDAPVPSAYTRAFLSPTLPGSVATFGLPIPNGVTLTSAATVTAAALKLNSDELLAIRADAQLADGNTPVPLTVAALSTLMANARMASALGISASDLILWKSLANTPSAFGVAGSTPATTAEFLRRYDLLSTTKLAPTDLDYVMRGGSADRSSLVISNDTVAQDLGEVRAGLQKTADKIAGAGPLQADRAKTLLALVPLAGPDVATVVQIVEGAYSGGAQNAFLSAHCPFLSAGDVTALAGAVTSSADIEPRYRVVADAAQPYVKKSLDHDFIKQKISAQTGIEIHAADVILTNVPVTPGARLLLEVLGDSQLLARDGSGAYLALTPGQFPDAFAAYALLAKLQALLGVTKLTSPEVRWVLGHAGAGKWLDTVALAADPYSVLEAVLIAARLQHTMRAGTITFFQFVDAVLAATKLADAAAAVANLLGWDPVKDIGQITALIGQFGIAQDADTPKLAQRTTVDCLLRAANAVKGLGVDASLALTFAKASPTQADAAAIRQTLKAKYDAATWDGAVTPIEDAQRDKKRDALVSYLLGHPADVTWQTPDDLYAWFLIDTQMEPCQLTTRIKQATASVQLFVQRCFLQLETQVVVNKDQDPTWSQWTWMQRFRVWQAAREIFMWPENYLLPELRVDRSPFFDDMVKKLLQGDITSDATEAAFRAYLRGLSDVARLQVAAHFHQVELGRDVLHVFARSRGTPPAYYYRQLIDGQTWTAWTKLDIGISGEHLLVVEWDRRLHLLWPTFTSKAKAVSADALKIPSGTGGTVGAPGPGSSPAQPTKIWEIQMAWSELRDGQWTSKRITSEKLIDPTYSDPASICFKATVAANDSLLVYVYRDAFDVTFQNVSFGSDFLDITVDLPSSVTEDFQHFGQFSLTDVYDDVVVSSRDAPLNVSDYTTEDRVVASRIQPLPVAQQSLVLPGAGTMAMVPWFQRIATANHAAPNQKLIASAGNPIADAPLLDRTTNAQVVIAQQDLQFDSLTPFFIEDQQRSFFVSPEYLTTGSHPTPLGGTPTLSSVPWATNFHLAPFYHPFLRTLIRELNRGGVPSLLARDLQVTPDAVRGTATFDFKATYAPTNLIDTDFPREDIDFLPRGAYSLYNWELFFHAPLLIALRLSTNQKFDEARAWFQYIFDPTDGRPRNTDPTPVSHFWRTKPFFNQTDYQNEEIKALLELVSLGTPSSATTQQLETWRKNPGDAHAIATLRPVAYQKTTVMKYIDNLIAWADQLFTRDTMETQADATQLYVMASNLLGPRPEQTRPSKPPVAATYGQLLQSPYKIDDFSNALVNIENLLPAAQQEPVDGTDPNTQQLPILYTQYFCLPPNPNLLAYWDTVADRLFKIRHCENIEGQVQQLPLYEPPINPMLLAQAAAAGVDLSSVLADEDAPLPFYRYRTMLAKAIEICGEVKSLGAQLLAALEKKDAEALAALRATQELAVMTLMHDSKVAAVTEAQANRTVLDKTEAMTQTRLDHYNTLKTSGWNSSETAAVTLSAIVSGIYAAEAVLFGVCSALKAVPQFVLGAAGFGGSPTAHVDWGGDNLAGVGHMAALSLDKVVAALSQGAQLSQQVAGYQRRGEDWDLQIALATNELHQISQQQVASDVRVAIAQNDLQVHELSSSNAQAVSDFLTKKFTAADLYDFLAAQLATVYFQAYQLAYELAKKAERCYNFELGTEETFIRFGYWDSLHRGLLAGELLSFDLRRMEASYCDRNKRELEVTKHFSLALNRPDALVQLRTTGVATFALLESDFDDDYPGHYFRRLKSVSLTVPCVTGPYMSVNSTLTLTSSSVRVKPDTQATSLQTSVGGVQAIATSTAQGDAGLFEVNFQDERYLPFEGQGAVSSWQLELLQDTNAFDVGTITDVVLHLKYSARPDASLKAAVLPQVQAAARVGALFLSAKSQFPDDLYRFLHPTTPDQTLSFALDDQIFPAVTRGKSLSVTKVEVLLVFKDPSTYTAYANATALSVHLGLNVNAPNPPPAPTNTDKLTLATNGAPVNTKTTSAGKGVWYLTALEADIAPTALNANVPDGGGTPHNRLDPNLIDDMILVVSYMAQ